MSERNRITIAGETYSANLGDGVIAESIAHLLAKADPTIRTTFADISGRDGWQTHSPHKQIARTDSPAVGLPPRLNNRIRWHVARKARYRTTWQAHLDGASALLVGGGQLLMDNDLDFPLKVQAIVHAAAVQMLPVHFVACGVNPNWSSGAARLFRDALRNAKSISVRDAASAEALRKLVPWVEPLVVFDPAIWAADFYGHEPNSVRRPVVGLGVIGLDTVNRRFRETLNETQLSSLWQGVIQLLARRGQAFELFTNGSPDDHNAALKLAELTEKTFAIQCPVAPRPLRPVELAWRISNYSALIAARLHASIIATSYLIPVVGLSWDTKVERFYEAIGRSELSLDLVDTKPEQIMEALQEASDIELDPACLDSFRASAMSGIALALSDIAG